MCKRGFLLIISSLFFLKICTNNSLAATFYLSPIGNDSNQGTQASPWKTISKANSSIAVGDTIILQDGTYTAYTPITKANTVWKAQNKHKAVIDGGFSPALLNGQWSNIVSAYDQKCSGMGTWANLIRISANNVTVDGLFLRNSCGRGVLMDTGSSNSILKNNWIDWTMQAGLYVGAETQGIQVIGNYLTRNSFGDVYKMHTSGDYSVNISVHMSGEGMIVRDNIFAWGRGEIAMTGARNLLVEKNIFVGNKNNFYPGWAQNVIFRNNLVYAPESQNTTGTHWEKINKSTHNWHMSTRNEMDDRWSDYATGLTNIAYYNNLIINNQIGFDGYHRRGGTVLYSTDTTKLYFGHNTVIAGAETEKLFGATFRAVTFEGTTKDSIMTGIIESNVFDTRKNPQAKVDISLSQNDRVTIRNNVIPTNTDESFNGEGTIRTDNPGLIDSARRLTIVPPAIGLSTVNITELQQAARVMDYMPQVSGPGKDRGSIAPGTQDTSIPAQARASDYLLNSRDMNPDIGALEYNSSGGYADPPISGTNLSLRILLHGIGNGGDNVSPTSLGNMNPERPSRSVSLELYNSSNQSMGVKVGTVSFNQSTGAFNGVVNLGTIPTGAYTVKVVSPNYLRKSYPGIVSVTANQTITLPSISLVAGDSNNDNSLSVLDYNILIDCYSDLTPPRNCADSQKKQSSDLTDDGVVNQFDYNLFLRELSVQGDDEDITPGPTNPNPTNTPSLPTNTPPQGATNTPNPTNPPGNGNGEVKLFDEIVQFVSADNGFHRLHEGNTPWPPHVPTNWKQPTDYFNSTWQYRIQVIANPTNQASKLQLCFWKIPGFDPENCAFNIAQSGIGTYTYSSSPAISGASNGGWARISGSALDFLQPETYRSSIILRGPTNCVVTNKGQVANKCPELFDRLKDMRFKLTVIMVPSGRTFSGWGNY